MFAICHIGPVKLRGKWTQEESSVWSNDSDEIPYRTLTGGETLLNRRRRDLIGVLLEGGGPRTLADLASRLQVSTRTVRYDLDQVEDYLKAQGFTLHRRPRVGVWVEADGTEAPRLAEDLTPLAAYDYVLSPAERQQFILAWLLRTETPVRIADLAESLYVSRTTLFEDLKALERRLTRSGMSIERRAHTGIRLKGNEATWRRAAADLLGGAVDTGRLFRPPDDSGQALSRQMVSLIADVDTDRLAAAVRAAEERMGLTLADGAFMGLVLHLALAVKRLRAQKSIDMPETQLDALRQKPEFGSARAVAEAVEDALGVSLPPAEVGYITLHLLGARMREIFPIEGGAAAGEDRTAADRDSTSPGSDRMGTDRLAYDFACQAEALLGAPLKEDVELLSGLALHLAPTAERLRYGGVLRNPLLDEIKAVYPQIFWAAQQCAQMLTRAWGVEVPEEEVGYLAMHLGAAIERRRSRPTRPRVLLACGSGVGTARILESRLRVELPDLEVVGVVSSLHAVNSLEQWLPLDFIISTIDLASLPGGGTSLSGVPTLRVSPLLGAEDLARLRMALTRRNGKGSKEHGQPGSGARSARKGQGGPMLQEVMSRDAVALDVVAEGWEDAVRAAGGLLVRTGAAEERYVEAMVETVQKLGPYIVIGKGMAMPHARPESGSRRIGLSLVRLRRPVSFGHPEHDPVDLVFGLAAVDAQTHLTALRDLSQVLSDPERVRRIREAETVDDVMDLFAREEAEKRG